MNPLDELLAALAGVPHLPGAECRGRTELFDPPSSDVDPDDAATRKLRRSGSAANVPNSPNAPRGLTASHHPNGHRESSRDGYAHDTDPLFLPQPPPPSESGASRCLRVWGVLGLGFDLREALKCARLVLSLHAGRTPPPELVAHYRRLELLAAGGRKRNRRGCCARTIRVNRYQRGSSDSWCTSGSVRRIAETVLEGRRSARTGWIFERKAVEDYARYRRTAVAVS